MQYPVINFIWRKTKTIMNSVKKLEDQSRHQRSHSVKNLTRDIYNLAYMASVKECDNKS